MKLKVVYYYIRLFNVFWKVAYLLFISFYLYCLALIFVSVTFKTIVKFYMITSID